MAQDQATDLKSDFPHWVLCRKELRLWKCERCSRRVVTYTEQNPAGSTSNWPAVESSFSSFVKFKSHSAPGVLADCSTSPTSASRASNCSVGRYGTTLASFCSFRPASWLADSSKSLSRVSTILQRHVQFPELGVGGQEGKSLLLVFKLEAAPKQQPYESHIS